MSECIFRILNILCILIFNWSYARLTAIKKYIVFLIERYNLRIL
jgi:hypothetical protein